MRTKSITSFCAPNENAEGFAGRFRISYNNLLKIAPKQLKSFRSWIRWQSIKCGTHECRMRNCRIIFFAKDWHRCPGLISDIEVSPGLLR
jgi:hypothetical protein